MLEESLQAFRENIFSLSGRKQIPHKIYEILEKQLIKEEHGLVEEEAGDVTADTSRLTVHQHLLEQRDQAALLDMSKQIYGSMQTVLEFMDKGMKGLLSGDLTVALLFDTQRCIDKYQRKFDTMSNKMNDLVLK